MLWMKRRHYILTPIGSSGDVHPYLGIGRELLARGHRVTMITGEPFQDAARALGLEFVASWDRASYEEITRDPNLWRTARGLRLVMRVSAMALERLYDLIGSCYRPGESVLAGHTLAFATRVFEEKNAAPAATIHLAPSAFRSDYAQPAVPPGLDISRLPQWTKRALWLAIDRMVIDTAIAPELNKFRARLGLPPVKRIFKDWLHSPQKVIGLFPPWFAPAQRDWPSQLALTSFPLYDEQDLQTLSPELLEFLDSGSPPIVITAGTGNRQAARFMQTSVRAIRAAGRRGLFLTPYEEQVPRTPPNSRDILHVRYAPFSKLLPRCAAIIHHGGIGTTAQSLAAGIPQLIVPISFDQPDNAMRVLRLKTGRLVSRYRYGTRTATARLQALLRDSRILQRCAEVAAALDLENGIGDTCDILESI